MKPSEGSQGEQDAHEQDCFDGGGQQDRQRYALVGAVEAIERGTTGCVGGRGCHRFAS